MIFNTCNCSNFEKKIKMLLLNTIDLKKEFKNPHCVHILSITSYNDINLALLNIWIKDDYQSIEQVVVCFKKQKIVDIYKDIFQKGVLWRCIYSLENGDYWLGGDYSSLNSGAKLSLFKKNQQLYTRTFDEGYSTEITKIENSNDGKLLINGNWYECVPAGGHDDFYPVRWNTKITKEGQDFLYAENPVLNQSYFSKSMAESDSENFYVLEDYGISKYSVEGNLLWNQGLGHFGQEELMPLNKMVPYYKTQNGITFADGVWFSGMDTTPSDRSLGKPILGRVTAGGTILSFEEQLSNFPEIHKIHTIIPGQDINCLLVCETLHIGKGSGLCLLSIHFSFAVCTMYIKYLNFSTNDLELSVSDYPWFQERYVDIKGIYPQGSCFEDLKEIIIFGNVNYLQNRDNGMVWTVDIKSLLN